MRPILAWAAILLGCTRSSAFDPAQQKSAPNETWPVTPTAVAPLPPPFATEPDVTGDTPKREDKGIFGELDAQVRTSLPSWVEGGPLDVWRSKPGGEGWVLAAGVPVARAAPDQRTTVAGESLSAHDLDADGLPDAFDILRGAKKVQLNAAEYRSNYLAIPYPMGDVPRTEGVCTDVVIRALRNAGIDLQRAITEDQRLYPKRYPGITNPDTHIDHRRVKNLLPWFKHHWDSLGTRVEDSQEPWLPGDLVFFDTLSAAGPDHLGILSDEPGPSGLPLVINNWTDGHRESAMDLLPTIPITHRFRVPNAKLEAAKESTGLVGLLQRHGLTVEKDIDAKARAEVGQILLVVAPLWQRYPARLYRFERKAGRPSFVQVGAPIEAQLGAAGLGAGLGLHDPGKFSTPHLKSEGDKRSPAGIFTLGTAFGRTPKPPLPEVRWPWRQARPGDVFVDDPASKFYNTWQLETVGHDWRSREDLTQYELAIVVEHNPERVPKRGSAIFIHDVARLRPTVGCTGLGLEDLTHLLRWLDPQKHPVLVQLAGAVY